MAEFISELNKKISGLINGFLNWKCSDIEKLPSELQKEIQNSPQQSGQAQPLSSSSLPQQTANPQSAAAAQISQGPNSKQMKIKLSSARNGADSNKNKKMAAAMSVLLLVFIFVIVRATKPLSPQTAAANNSKNASGQTAAADKKIAWKAPEVYPSTLRDPMQPNSSSTGGQGDGSLIVRGIVRSEDRPSAVIGDKIVHQGDKIAGATVVQINKNNVEFEMNGKKWTQEVQR